MANGKCISECGLNVNDTFLPHPAYSDSVWKTLSPSSALPEVLPISGVGISSTERSMANKSMTYD
jgi:hypothetical protein